MDLSIPGHFVLRLPDLKEGGNPQDKRPRPIQVYSMP